MKITGDKLRLAASDVANFLACQHLTRLELLRARGVLAPPSPADLGFEELVRRGEEHEHTVVAEFRSAGWRVTEIPADTEDSAAATVAAIRAGAEVIYQGVLRAGPAPGQPALLGRPDFLVRADLLAAQDGEPRPAGTHYEVVDAKLARSAKARAVAQTAFYSHLLTGVQGTAPRWMHLALGNGERAAFKVSDFAAYERQARRTLAEFIAADPGTCPPADPYPEPVPHCAICRWSDFCAARRRRDDDLSLVAGLTSGQRRTLKAAGVTTRRGLAALAALPAVARTGRQSLERAQIQARLQVASEDAGKISYQLLDCERDAEGRIVPNRGLLALPQPAIGDLFFDIEGARYYSEDGREFGLQYLFGIVDTADTDETGKPRYRQIWCFDRQGEKRAFEELIDFITERRERNPNLHVYHYNHYEPTSVDHLTELHETRQEAVGRLMGRFATREDEVDSLFRLGVFVDLYRVVRQGLRAGVESYSIKRLEPLCGYQRQLDLRDATASLIAFEASLEDGTAKEEAHGERQRVAAYNEDDCRATLALRDWLEGRRAELSTRLVEDPPRPQPGEDTEITEDPEVTRIRAGLLAGLPAEPAQRTDQEHARALLADLLDWHRREAKPAWWRYFYVRTLDPGELIGEPDALGGLTGGDIVEEIKRSVVRRFAFPPQEHRFIPGDTAHDSATDKPWRIHALDEERGTIDLKIGSKYSGPLPAALLEGGPIRTDNLRDRLRDLGGRVVSEGVTGTDAATALLLRLPPATGQPQTAPLRREGEAADEAAIRLVTTLRDSCLPIQGPPGTGKTYLGAEQILALIQAERTVGITGPSHAVIHNLISEVCEHAAKHGLKPRIGQRADPGNPFLHPEAAVLKPGELAPALADGQLDLAAGTVWAWAHEELAGSVDTLFVDEAGQLSLANTLAVAGVARNLVLLGDPQQLAQPSQAAHPPGAGVSPLEHILGDRATMPADAGLLLDRTWRMHPRLCDFTSRVFYDGKVTCAEGLERQEILGAQEPRGAGLRIAATAHEGNASSSPEEAAQVARLVRGLLGRQWCTRDGEHVTIGAEHILVITPYNAHIREIEEALARAGCPGGIGVGTVDKFQGRQAPVSIYSMASSSPAEAPRGLEFLYDGRRLNVATSRARAMAVIVASPGLLRVACTTPRQMQLVNALCAAWETGAALETGAAWETGAATGGSAGPPLPPPPR